MVIASISPNKIFFFSLSVSYVYAISLSFIVSLYVITNSIKRTMDRSIILKPIKKTFECRAGCSERHLELNLHKDIAWMYSAKKKHEKNEPLVE